MEIGKKLRALRVRNGLTQEELATRCDLSKGFISQLERDITSPSIATLVDILECLGTDLKGFFNETPPERVVYGPQDVFDSADPERLTRTTWLIPNAQKNAMEPILLVIEPGGTTAVDRPHPGEEFGYVIRGTIKIHIGDTVHRARRGCAFSYKPTHEHYIENAGSAAAELLWISDPPSF